jgi:hypothetical protein
VQPGLRQMQFQRAALKWGLQQQPETDTTQPAVSRVPAGRGGTPLV